MNKYQDMLEGLIDTTLLYTCKQHKTFVEEDVEECRPLLYEACDKAKKYDELTKTPTLEEVKKEWEELGYECICDDEDLLEFKHKFLPQNIEFNKEHNWYGSTCNDITQFNIQEHLLITKTFRALGWEV